MRYYGCMTPDQFYAIASLLRLRGGPATEGARLVLVDGLSIVQAAERSGCSRQSVGNAMSRIRRGLELAKQAIQS